MGFAGYIIIATICKALFPFDFLANAGTQDEENSSKRTIALVDLKHLNNVNDPFWWYIILDPRIREEVVR